MDNSEYAALRNFPHIVRCWRQKFESGVLYGFSFTENKKCCIPNLLYHFCEVEIKLLNKYNNPVVFPHIVNVQKIVFN